VSERKTLFDAWAAEYDKSLTDTTGFPFEGYDDVLAGVVGGSGVEPGASILDVGTGTGTLSARFAELGSRVLGVDFSEAMLVQACLNVPEAQFAPLELLGSWDALNGLRFDAVVSSYVLHEFDAPTKGTLLTRMAGLLEPNGRLVVGDISFETAAGLAAAQRRWERVWDKDEHYWVAEEMLPLLKRLGFQASYRQVSFCAGVYVMTRSDL
jgi:putative AdoMet-dependent methyltransferase